MTMHSRIREVVALLEQSRNDLRGAVDSVLENVRDTKPAPDRWSTAEVLDHLTKVESAIARLLSARIAEARANGLRTETDTSPVVSAAVLTRLQDRSSRIEAAGGAQPDEGVAWKVAWTALENTRAALLGAIDSGDGLALGDLTYPHRVLGPLNFYQWIVFVAGHEARHAAQIRANAEALRQDGPL